MSSAYARSGGLSISFSAPVLGGGDPLQGYTLTARGGRVTRSESLRAGTTSAVLKGLQNDRTYKLELIARSAAGASAPGWSNGTPEAVVKATPPLSLSVDPSSRDTL